MLPLEVIINDKMLKKNLKAQNSYLMFNPFLLAGGEGGYIFAIF